MYGVELTVLSWRFPPAKSSGPPAGMDTFLRLKSLNAIKKNPRIITPIFHQLIDVIHVLIDSG